MLLSFAMQVICGSFEEKTGGGIPDLCAGRGGCARYRHLFRGAPVWFFASNDGAGLLALWRKEEPFIKH
jgi:hypothetical protein